MPSPASSSAIPTRTLRRVPSRAPSANGNGLPRSVSLRKRKRVETDGSDSSEDAEASDDLEALGYSVSEPKEKKRAAGEASVSRAPTQSQSPSHPGKRTIRPTTRPPCTPTSRFNGRRRGSGRRPASPSTKNVKRTSTGGRSVKRRTTDTRTWATPCWSSPKTRRPS
jgi:hypothetical protein